MPPDLIGAITSPASRSADVRDSTTTVARAASASSVSRRSGSWPPIATTVAVSLTSEPSNSGADAVVQQQMMSAPRTSSSMSPVVAADEVDVLDRPDRADRSRVRVPPRPATEDQQPPGVLGGEMPDRERRHRGRAHVRDRDAVRERGRRERLRVEDHHDPLDARVPADAHELDGHVPADLARHHDQLAAA